MVKLIDGKHYMTEAGRLYDFQMKVNWITRVITLEDENAAERLYSKLNSSRGVFLSVRGRTIKAYIPAKLIECVD